MNHKNMILKCKWFKYDLGYKYHAPEVRSDQSSKSWSPDHESTFHVTETPALTTQWVTALGFVQ